MPREKPVSRRPRSFRVNWGLIGYLLGGLAIIAVALFVLWLVSGNWITVI